MNQCTRGAEMPDPYKPCIPGDRVEKRRGEGVGGAGSTCTVSELNDEDDDNDNKIII